MNHRFLTLAMGAARRHLRFGIAPKILSAVLLLAATAVAIGWLGFDAFRTYGRLVAEINNASSRAILGEQLNGLINTVVMDSRGIYMSKSKGEAEKFALPLLTDLEVIKTKAAAWENLLGPSRRPELDGTLVQLRAFIGLREEVVRRARREGPEAARALGDDDVVRANRQALNRQIGLLASANVGEVDRLAARLELYRHRVSAWLLTIGLAGVGCSVTLAAWIVIGAVTRPLARMACAIRSLAEGDMSVEIPGRGRGDEIGTIAQAVEVFRSSMIEVEHLRERRWAELETDRMRGLVAAAAEGLMICEGDTIVTSNTNLAEMAGISSARERVMGVAALLPNEADRTALRGARSVARETVLCRADGSLIPIEAVCRTVDFLGRPHDAFALRDLRPAKKVEDELRQAQSFLNTVIEAVPAIIIVKNTIDLRYVLINKAAEEFYGITRDEVIDKTIYDLYPEHVADYIRNKYIRWHHDGQDEVRDEHEVVTPTRGTRLISTRTVPIRNGDEVAKHALTVIEDVTERRQMEKRVAHLAYHDALTDLHNRAAFSERLGQMLEHGAATGRSFAVLCLDLDHFKDINDLYGHSVGDAVLLEVAGRLRSAAEGAFIARQGGDEFALILSDGEQPGAAARLAEKLLAALADDIVVEGHAFRVGLSIGIAIYPSDGRDAVRLVGNADTALYRAKAEGRGLAHFFEHEMDARLRQRWTLVNDLRSALGNREICVHYQPQAKIDGQIFGFEALIRWQHPRNGLVPPSTFIPLAEENGLILPLGEWVLREACREAASWARPLQIAVNLSPVQFRHTDLPELVHAILLDTGLPAQRLELEITEGVLIGDQARALSILRRLKALGVKIAMDDFGTGYSSLSYLQLFPFDKIKIDKSFISSMREGSQAAAIVRAIIGLGQGLDVPIIAEGVEVADQLSFLRREGCQEVQGYFVGRPFPIEAYALETHGSAASRPEAGGLSAA